MMKIFKIFFGLIFILFSYFQVNDPDSGLWISIYSFAALACYMSLRELWPSWIYYILGAACLIGGIFLWPPQYEGIFFGGMQMKTINIELARESLGLGITAIVMAILGKWG